MCRGISQDKREISKPQDELAHPSFGEDKVVPARYRISIGRQLPDTTNEDYAEDQHTNHKSESSQP